MPLPVKNTAPPRELPPAGTHSAICIGHYHLGTQETPFGEKEQLVLVFALDEHRSDGKPFIVSTNPLTVSFDDRATLAKLVKGFLGRAVAVDEEFDTASLVDKACLVSISHGVSKKGNAYASIDGLSKLPRGLSPMVCDLNTFDYSPIDPTRPIPEEVPKWIAEQIQASREWRAVHGEAPGGQPQGPAANGHVPGAAAGPGVPSAPPKPTMAQKGYLAALGLPWPFDDARLDEALDEARARGDSTEEEIEEAGLALRPLASDTIPF